MNTQQAFACVEREAPAYLDLLEEICSFEATARDKAELDRMLDHIEKFAHGCGFWTERTPFSACGDFLTVELNHGAAPGGVLMAHTDTVHKKGIFGTPPVRREGGRMIGPGTIDCKAGIAIALLTMRALQECGYSRCVRLLLTSDEEISNVLGGEAELQYFADGVKGFPFALTCEGAVGNDVVTSRKGIRRYELVVHGISGHAGMNYFKCKNAVLECAHKIVALEKNSVEGGMTFSCNVISAGSVSNVIPDTCRLLVDVRVVTHAQAAEADRILREIAAHSYIGGTTTDVTLLGSRPPMPSTPGSEALFEHLREVSRANGFGDLVPISSGGGSDAAHTQAAGVPSLCGVGGVGGFWHTTKEYIEMDSVAARAKLFCALFAADEGEA